MRLRFHSKNRSTVSAAEDRRRALAMKAWTEAFERLSTRAGDNWPMGTCLASPEVDAAEEEAEKATVNYIDGLQSGAREKLAAWEAMLNRAIDAALMKRGCDLCHVERVVEVVDPDGHRACGRCRAGGH